MAGGKRALQVTAMCRTVVTEFSSLSMVKMKTVGLAEYTDLGFAAFNKSASGP